MGFLTGDSLCEREGYLFHLWKTDAQKQKIGGKLTKANVYIWQWEVHLVSFIETWGFQ